MPRGLHRFQQSKTLHYFLAAIGRLLYLEPDRAKRQSEQALEQARRQYRMYVIGYVVMPEHVHMLVTEPERGRLALKQLSSLCDGRGWHGRDRFATRGTETKAAWQAAGPPPSRGKYPQL
jgi:REP element-mobilizing transposase RayT